MISTSMEFTRRRLSRAGSVFEKSSRMAGWLLLTSLVFAAAGCAGFQLKNPLPVTEDVHAKKEQRREEIVRDYEEKRSQALYQAAMTRLRQGDDAGCRKALQQLLQLNPQHAEGRLLKAEDHLMRYELLEAQKEIEQVLAFAPEHPQALHALGLVKEALGESQAAAEFFGRAAELAPEDQVVTIDYQTSMDPDYHAPGFRPESQHPADLQQGNAAPLSGVENMQANKMLAERASENPRTRALIRRGLTFLSAGDTVESVTQIKQAMSFEPENIRIPQLVALEAIKLNHPEIACELLDTSLTKFADSAVLYRLYGFALYRDQQFPAAEQALRKAVVLDNRDALAYFLLGQVFSRLGDSDQSQQFLTEAQRLDPSLSAQALTR